jgi:hypothetical protein
MIEVGELMPEPKKNESGNKKDLVHYTGCGSVGTNNSARRSEIRGPVKFFERQKID